MGDPKSLYPEDIGGIFIENTPLIVVSAETRVYFYNFHDLTSKYPIFFGACGGLDKKVLVFERFRTDSTSSNQILYCWIFRNRIGGKQKLPSKTEGCSTEFLVLAILQWYQRAMLLVKRKRHQKGRLFYLVPICP